MVTELVPSTPHLPEIKLGALVRKTKDSAALKTLIRTSGARLTRKGRSRNWLLSANNQQIQQIIDLIYLAEQDSWLWLVKVLAENRKKLSKADLLAMVKDDPSMTVKQLVVLSDCTLAEARICLDEAQWG